MLNRVRLRLPDSDSETTDFPEAEVEKLLADVEYNEVRLKRLREGTTWREALESWVESSYNSDEDEDYHDSEDEVQAPPKKKIIRQKKHIAPGYLKTTVWSLLTVVSTPLLLLVSPFLQHKSSSFWPLNATSAWSLWWRSILHLEFLLLGLVLLYYTLCSELPEVDMNTFIHVNASIEALHSSINTCSILLDQTASTKLVQDVCVPTMVQVTFICIILVFILRCHRTWARYGLIFIGVLLYVNAPSMLTQQFMPKPQITSVDPSYVLLHEETVVSISGDNLQPGGTIAWVAYWGCANAALVTSCEKQFPGVFDRGSVAVTFDTADRYIPCYRDPPDPLKEQEFVCFEDVRISVREQNRIPGWSMMKRWWSKGETERDTKEEAPKVVGGGDNPEDAKMKVHHTLEEVTSKVEEIAAAIDMKIDQHDAPAKGDDTSVVLNAKDEGSADSKRASSSESIRNLQDNEREENAMDLMLPAITTADEATGTRASDGSLEDDEEVLSETTLPQETEDFTTDASVDDKDIKTADEEESGIKTFVVLKDIGHEPVSMTSGKLIDDEEEDDLMEAKDDAINTLQDDDVLLISTQQDEALVQEQTMGYKDSVSPEPVNLYQGEEATIVNTDKSYKDSVTTNTLVAVESDTTMDHNMPSKAKLSDRSIKKSSRERKEPTTRVQTIEKK